MVSLNIRVSLNYFKYTGCYTEIVYLTPESWGGTDKGPKFSQVLLVVKKTLAGCFLEK